VQITIETDDGPMPAYEARPESPGVRWWWSRRPSGDHPHRDIARRLAEAGWLAVARPSSRQGSPVLDYDDLAKVMPIMSELTAGGLTTDLAATWTTWATRASSRPGPGWWASAWAAR